MDFIAAEDTRVTRKLLQWLEIKKPLVSYHEHNRAESGEKIINRILDGENCALVTDAGTPAISDPGEELVKLCISSGIDIISIPGPCAAIAALVLSGMSTGRFSFEGFLSTTKKNRLKRLDELKDEKRTMVFYEAPHKVLRTLNDMLAIFGDRSISISRELTKIHEETFRCKLSEAIARYAETSPRGEFVIVVEGAANSIIPEMDISLAIEAALAYIQEGHSTKDAVKTASKDTGIAKNILYSSVLQLIGGSQD